jgi:hypothetical protein
MLISCQSHERCTDPAWRTVLHPSLTPSGASGVPASRRSSEEGQRLKRTVGGPAAPTAELDRSAAAPLDAGACHICGNPLHVSGVWDDHDGAGATRRGTRCHAGGVRLSQFRCRKCASPAIAAPVTLEDLSPISCRRCGAALGTWRELKERALRGAGSSGWRVSCDPLPPSQERPAGP